MAPIHCFMAENDAALNQTFTIGGVRIRKARGETLRIDELTLQSKSNEMDGYHIIPFDKKKTEIQITNQSPIE